VVARAGISQEETSVPKKKVEHWSLNIPQKDRIKIGAKIAGDGRDISFQLAEVAIPGALSADIMCCIDWLRPRPPP
jgi:hypothetical protein